MSIPPSNQHMGELPSPSTPLPKPNLNFTVQIHSLLNGESPAVNTPDNNVPGAPVSILVTSSQGENNGALDTRDGIGAGNTRNIDEADTTSGQGGVDPDETSDVDTESVQCFFNLDMEQQAETLIRYQQHLSKVVNQNKQMADMIDKINVDCQGLTTQVETALCQNADLLKTLKETPSVETITNQVKDTLDREYELKFKNLEDQLVCEKQVQEEIHKDNLKKQDSHYSGLLKQGLSKMKANYESKIKETLAENESRFQRQQQEHRAQLEALTTELDKWKWKSSTVRTGMVETATKPAGEHLGQLKQDIFNFLPSTVKTDRGGAVTTPQSTGTTPLYVPNMLPSPHQHLR